MIKCGHMQARRMKWVNLFVGMVMVTGGAVLGFFGMRQVTQEVTAQETVTVPDIVSGVLEAREQAILAGNGEGIGSEDEINVLLLGLDARKDWDEAHCDAIHMFTLNIEKWTIQITTVPRGTYAYIPPGTYPPNEYYVSNACGLAGIEYGIEQIERISGIQADYVVKVGFSQVSGILRFFQLPTTSTLEWLRHRQSYAIGEPQRSHNQAVFLKDLILRELGLFRKETGYAMEYLLYRMVDTDMDFATAHTLLHGYLDAELDQHPENITLLMKPSYPVIDYHLDFENPDAQVQPLIDFLKPYLNTDDLSGKTAEEIQQELMAYLASRLATEESIQDLYEKQLWLQVESAQMRENFQYQFVERRAQELLSTDRSEAINIVSDYILEKQTLGPKEYEDKGRSLLDQILKS